MGVYDIEKYHLSLYTAAAVLLLVLLTRSIDERSVGSDDVSQLHGPVHDEAV